MFAWPIHAPPLRFVSRQIPFAAIGALHHSVVADAQSRNAQIIVRRYTQSFAEVVFAFLVKPVLVTQFSSLKTLPIPFLVLFLLNFVPNIAGFYVRNWSTLVPLTNSFPCNRMETAICSPACIPFHACLAKVNVHELNCGDTLASNLAVAKVVELPCVSGCVCTLDHLSQISCNILWEWPV